MVSFARPHYWYLVDADDIIRAVNADWLAFAAENGARQLTKPAVLGRSLWQFVAGKATIGLYQAVLARVRERQKPIVLPFRCDSPTLERYMRMNIIPTAPAQIRFDCVIEKVRPVARVNLLDPSCARSRDHLDMCSLCKRIEVRPLGWLEVAEAVGRLKLFDVEQVPSVRQVVCRDCKERVDQAANQLG